MAHVTKRRKVKPPAGCAEKRGAQVPAEDKIQKRAAEAIRDGEPYFEMYNDVWIIENGRAVNWAVWDRSRVGK